MIFQILVFMAEHKKMRLKNIKNLELKILKKMLCI